MPQVATFEEPGLKLFNFSIWYALMSPARIQPEVVAKIGADVQMVLSEPATRDKNLAAGVEPYSANAAGLPQLTGCNLARYAQLARSADIKAE